MPLISHGGCPFGRHEDGDFTEAGLASFYDIETHRDTGRSIPDDNRIRSRKGREDQGGAGDDTCDQRCKPGQLILRRGLAAAFLRPLDEVVFVIENPPAVLAELRSRPHPAHIVQGALLEAKKLCGLSNGQEGVFRIVGHQCLPAVSERCAECHSNTADPAVSFLMRGEFDTPTSENAHRSDKPSQW